MSNPLNKLIPKRVDGNELPQFRWATVTSVSPLRIMLEGALEEVNGRPSKLIPMPSPGDRVFVLTMNRRNIILGKANGASDIPSLHVQPELMYGPVGPAPLTIPTHVSPGGGETTHPYIAYIPAGLSGYRYWMAHTPYPAANNDHEDPNISASNDGTTWVVPAGLTNPIDDKSGTPDYNSDTCLVYELGQLHLWWRHFDENATGQEEKIRYSASSDGITWSTPVVVLQNNMATRRPHSPTVVYENGIWTMWCVDTVQSPKRIIRMTASSPEGPWSAPINCTIATVPSGQEPWHPEVRRVGERYVMLLNTTTTGTNGILGDLIWATSSDGLSWSGMSQSTIPKEGNGHTSLYKATFLPAGDGFDVWYGGRTNVVPSAWNVYRTHVSLYEPSPSWKSYPVSFFSATGGTSPTMGNSTLIGRYWQAGKTVHVSIYFQAGSTLVTGTGAWGVTLPVPARTDMWQLLVVAAVVTGATGLGDYTGSAKIEGSGGVLRIQIDDKAADARMSSIGGAAPYVIPASPNRILISGTYEAA